MLAADGAGGRSSSASRRTFSTSSALAAPGKVTSGKARSSFAIFTAAKAGSVSAAASPITAAGTAAGSAGSTSRHNAGSCAISSPFSGKASAFKTAVCAGISTGVALVSCAVCRVASSVGWCWAAAAAARRCARVGFSASAGSLGDAASPSVPTVTSAFNAAGCDFGKSRAAICTGSASRSTFSPFSSKVAASLVGPNHGSPLKSPGAGWPTKETGLKRCSVAKASASSSVSRARTATLTFAPVPDQSKTRSSTL